MNPLHRLREIAAEIAALTAEQDELEFKVARAIEMLEAQEANREPLLPAPPVRKLTVHLEKHSDWNDPGVPLTAASGDAPEAAPARLTADEGLNLAPWARAQRNATEKQMRVELRNFFIVNPGRWFAVGHLAKLIQRGEGKLRKRVAYLMRAGFLQIEHRPSHDSTTARMVPVYALHPDKSAEQQALVKTTNSTRTRTPKPKTKKTDVYRKVSEGTYAVARDHVLAQLPERGITGKSPMELITNGDQPVCARSTFTMVLNRMMKENLLKALGDTRSKKYLRM